MKPVERGVSRRPAVWGLPAFSWGYELLKSHHQSVEAASSLWPALSNTWQRANILNWCSFNVVDRHRFAPAAFLAAWFEPMNAWCSEGVSHLHRGAAVRLRTIDSHEWQRKGIRRSVTDCFNVVGLLEMMIVDSILPQGTIKATCTLLVYV